MPFHRLVQEEDLLLVQEEDLLLVQEEDLLLVQEADLLLLCVSFCLTTGGILGTLGLNLSGI